MEIGRLIFIVNRASVLNPADRNQGFEVKCEAHGFEGSTAQEAIGLICSLSDKASVLSSNILRSGGLSSQKPIVHNPNGGL